MKIDYVLPYVDNTDPAWQKLYSQYNIENGHSISENSKRFSVNPLFRYVFRGIEKYMPWINNVFLIVQSESQIPRWINRDSVKIVLHEDFIPKEYLPTFNSCTIECFIHKIPGLSPFYIYGNDDTYVMNRMKISDFFEDCMPKNCIDHFHFYHKNDEYERMCMNMNKTVLQQLNRIPNDTTFLTPIHFQQAFSKSIVENIFRLFEDRIYGSLTRFRSEKNFSQYFFILYYMLSTANKYKFKDVKFKRADIVSELNMILNLFDKKKFPQLLCLNNNDGKKDFAFISQFQIIFPNISKYEF